MSRVFMVVNLVDLFSGAGGLSKGFELAGFNVLCGIEKNIDAAKTYSINHPKSEAIVKDIRKITGKEIKSRYSSEITVIAGGPPCQGFSTAGRRMLDDPRNILFREFYRIVKEVSPPAFVFENVKGLLSFDKGRTISKIDSLFKSAGYKTQLRILDSSMFNVPQKRERIFLIGSKENMCDFKIPESYKSVSVRDAISDLAFLGIGEIATKYKLKPRSEYQKSMRDTKKLHNHESSNHSKKVIRRFSLIKPGKTGKDLPDNLKTKKSVLFRLRSSQPARTVTTLPDDLIHYSKDRILTVREMARIQSFPDSYVFLGPRTTGGMRRKSQCPQYTQVGNAVPPLMAKEVAKYVISQVS